MVKGVDSDQTPWVQIPAPPLIVGPKLCCLASWGVVVCTLMYGSSYLTGCCRVLQGGQRGDAVLSPGPGT